MVSIHIKDEVAMRYAIATGDKNNFKGFVNKAVEAAVGQVEEEGEKGRGRGGK